MPIVNLRALGSIQSGANDFTAADGSFLERPAMLVYSGQFESADGPVDVTSDHLTTLVSMHNGRVEELLTAHGGEIPMKEFPPIQLDHSSSALHTVGRVVGKLSLGQFKHANGLEVPAIYGMARFMGKENIEKVEDGRWTHLSVGADFENGYLRELTVTPFPAAPKASLLSENLKVTKLSAEGTVAMRTKEEMRKYLTSRKGLSENDADMHLSKCDADAAEMSKLSAECDEDDKKLSEENADKDRKDKEEKEKASTARMSAARTQITQLSAGFTSHVTAARLAAKQGKILTRLSRLRAAGKITPAEVKKLDVRELAAAADASVDLVMKSYENREPVIHVGQLGSIKGTDLSQLSAGREATSMSELEAETRKNMSLLANNKTPEGTTELSSTRLMPAPTVSEEDARYFEREYGELVQLMDNGKGDEAKTKLKAHFGRMAALGFASIDAVTSSTGETEVQLSALAENVGKMQTEFEHLQKLAGDLVGA